MRRLLRLKEFDLDLPNADRETRHKFRLQSRCVSALYERCFPKMDVAGGWKVLIECVDRVERPDVRNLLGVFAVQVRFRYEQFLTLEQLQRKKMLLETLHLGALRIAKAQGWAEQPFEMAYQCVVDRDYVNEWTWPPKPKVSADRKHQAMLLCSHEMDRFRAWLVVQDRKGKEIIRHLAIDEDPDEFLFVPKMGKLIWTSDHSVELIDKNGQRVTEISLPHANHASQPR